ncbi:hypothetical protein [Vibrio algivorus]|uniref:hypothetical protein n=1 Tax=Vibrio algivorus TaxID=1667024 RepID=UPI001642C2A8|nr:hypothetical protein [Vibrio algivorus]
MSDKQVQCAECYCTIYFTDGSYWGITGELCYDCEKKKEAYQYLLDDDDLD